MANKNNFLNAFGLISSVLGFESAEAQKSIILDFTVKSGHSIIEFIDLNELLNAEELLSSVTEIGPAAVICSRLALLLTSREFLYHFWNRSSECIWAL